MEPAAGGGSVVAHSQAAGCNCTPAHYYTTNGRPRGNVRQNTKLHMTPGSLDPDALVHIVQNFGIHNVVYKRQAWGIAPCFYLPQSVIALAKASLFGSIVLFPRALYMTRPVCKIALLIILVFQKKCRYHSKQVNASRLDYSFFVISIHFSVEKDLGLLCARVSNQVQAMPQG